jgi:chromosome segregation ATPase
MKKALLSICIILLFAVSAYAQVNPFVSLNEELKSIEAEKASILNEDAANGKSWQSLNPVIESWKKAKDNNAAQYGILESNVNAMQAEKAQRDVQVAEHNRTANVPRNPSDLASYNANSQRLNEWKAKLDARHYELRKKLNDLDWSRDQLEKQRIKLKADQDALVNKDNQLKTKWQKVLDREAALKKKHVDVCKELLKDPARRTDEDVKLGCGNVQFDGENPNLPPLTENKIKPPFKATPNN